ncbi:MAG: TIGR02710 family CRISPR-associated protein [Bryobacterales bacterium]|nr:TIGR02710 family CRISPR-associated protein [Bryobacterales bacterium]
MPRGAIFSLGGTPTPVIEALKRGPVECALFVVSEKSEPLVEQSILPAIGYLLQWECVRMRDPDDLNTCYQEIRRAISDWLDRRRLQPEQVYFDLTGGTKPMSAALTLAAVERIPLYHYVSGAREKEGLGTVITGTERSITGLNPWKQFAIRQRELATQLYEQGHIEAAAELLDQASQSVTERSETLKALARLCRVLAKLDLFQFKGLPKDLGQCRRQLEVAFEQHGADKLITWLRELWVHVQALEAESRSRKDHPRSLLELLANARRRHRQHRHDDAIARLYRAAELYAQNRLYAAFGATSGHISLASLDGGLAANLRSAFPDDLVYGERLQLSCAKGFAALKYSPLVEDHRLPEVYECLKPALEKRNQSWLAHGTRPAESADFDQMWELLIGKFGIAESAIPEWPKISFIDY